MSLRLLAGIALVALAASGCGLKGPLFLPEKSDVTIRPVPATTSPEAPTEPAPATEGPSAPGPTQAQPPQDPAAGPDRG